MRFPRNFRLFSTNYTKLDDSTIDASSNCTIFQIEKTIFFARKIVATWDFLCYTEEKQGGKHW